MRIFITLLIIAVSFYVGLKTVLLTLSTKSHSLVGRRTINNLAKWQREKRGFWEVPPFKQLARLISRIIFVDDVAALRLENSLKRAGLSITPREFTARKYIICISGFILLVLFAHFGFYFGIILDVLVMIYALMKQRDAINANIKKKELLISMEMPRFARTICRSLQSDRDLYNAVRAYRKVAGQELGSELDILLAEMSTGNIQNALMHFENRIGTAEAFRLCGAFSDITLGIDQTATLSYIADDMARQANENVKKELSLRPGKMRMSYFPAIAVCIAMIMYVLVVYVMNNLYSLF